MNRKDFIKNIATITGGGLLIPRFLHPLLGQNMQSNLRESFNNKIVVIVNLSGGNDGLNTVVPYTNDIYYNLRPNIGIPSNNVLSLTNSLGLNPSMGTLHNLWSTNNLSVIQNVGYSNQNLSHFRSTDIWRSGSSSNEIISTGWIARFIESVVPDIHMNPPYNPIAFQIGNSNTLQLTGQNGMTGVLVQDPETFYDLVNETYDEPILDENTESTAGRMEANYIRQISALSYNYANVINQASINGTNTVDYANNTPGKYLKIVAKLISGGMYSPFFLVHHGGFDNHSNQNTYHPGLLERLSDSIGSFSQDLYNQGLDDNVIIMTTSEFGRRTYENGAFGTDHGGAAPHFLVGKNINSGVFGGEPDLENLINGDNLVHSIDYRQIFATIIKDWFGYSDETVSQVFNNQYDTLDLFNI